MRAMHGISAFAAIGIMSGGCAKNVPAPVSMPILSKPITLKQTVSKPVTIFTAANSVTCLLSAPDGTFWVGTQGGIWRRDAQGQWQKFTRQDGLPSHETRALHCKNGTIVATFPRKEAIWNGAKWSGQKSDLPEPQEVKRTAATVWQGKICYATPAELVLGEGTEARKIALPPSPGTHVSALLPQGDKLWAMLFGDRLWAFDGTNWTPASIELPPQIHDVTALAMEGQTLWIGTRQNGVWKRDGEQWTQPFLSDEPFNHNAQFMAWFRGTLFVSTLEDGLVARTPQGGWQHFAAPTLSSNIPRQMTVFRDKLYVRHSNGRVDRFDGVAWERNVITGISRPDVSSIAADSSHLFITQWGGWSESDGANWKQNLNIPELQALPLTCLLPDGKTLWIGTQGRGLLEVPRLTGKRRWHDERGGLSDDWITCLAKANGTLYAGTFVGGLARYDGKRWRQTPELAGQNVTALAADGKGGLLISTRQGVWKRNRNGKMRWLASQFPLLKGETQALCMTPEGLWIGTRTALMLWKNEENAKP